MESSFGSLGNAGSLALLGLLFAAVAGFAWLCLRQRAALAKARARAAESDALAARLAEAVEADRAKAALLDSLRREIRSPLDGIVGATSLLRHTDLSPGQLEPVETLQVSGEVLLGLVSEMRAGEVAAEENPAGESRTGREREGRGRPREKADLSPFGLEEVVEQSFALVAPLAAQKGLHLCHTLTAGAPDGLVGDAPRIRKVLVGLLSHAVRLVQPGELWVVIAAREVGREGHEVRFSLHDSSSGMDAAGLSRDLDAAGTGNGAAGGTGAPGLAACKRLAARLGGRIWVEGSGDGATLHFTVRGRAVGAPAPVGSEGERRLRAVATGQRVLLAESDLIGQKTALAMLRRLGYEAQVASAGRDLVRALENDSFDAVVLDELLPGLDRRELVRRLGRGRGPRPALVVLAPFGAARPAQASEPRPDAVLSKPLELGALEAALRGAARRSSA